jgi:hypothetical protein
MLTPACLSRPTGRTLVCAGLFLLALTTSTTPSMCCPHPDDLVVTGPDKKKALEQLQAAVNRCLSLRIDELSGNVVCERNKKANGHFVSLIYMRYLDNENKETFERSEVYFVELYIKSDDQPEKLIRRLYKDKSICFTH